MSEFSKRADGLSKKIANLNIAVAQEQHEILHDKRKNNKLPKRMTYGRPKNTPFAVCIKPQGRCDDRAVADGLLYCMAEIPCWRKTHDPPL